MRPKLTLRWRLTLWYGSIALLSLIAFAFFAYLWVSNELYSNLDSSLIKISNTLVHIIEEGSPDSIHGTNKGRFAELLSQSADKFTIFRQEEKSRFVGPLRPDKVEKSDKEDIVWSAIFRHILLNPENYYIQIADTNGKSVWKSRNLGSYDLPIDSSIYKMSQSDRKTGKDRYMFDNVIIDNQKLRLLININYLSNISIAYTIKDVSNTLQSLFSAILLAVPVILLISVMGGMFLAKMSLKPVDRITKTANEITATNLSLRLEEPEIDDEILRLAKTLNEMIGRLEQSFNRIRQFTSDASHELRTPLTILRGEIEIALSKERTVEIYTGVLSSALDEVQRLSNVVQSLLELSSADAGKDVMQFKRDNISIIIEEIVEDMSILAEQKNIELISEIKKGLIINIDSEKLYQAFLNVIDNSVKYTQDNGKVIVSLKDFEHYIEFQVSDNGIGMTQEELSNIFDRFYRVDKARSSENIKGSGLGLSIVKWIIEAHNGKIFVDSKRDKGTNFIIMLPKEQIVSN